MPLPFNQASSNNEGGATITIDNKHLFFTVNTKGNFDICTSDRENGRWEIRNLGPNVNDPKQWDSQPTIAPDGKTLYFASARDAATGIDLYVTTRSDDGTWNKARKLRLPSTRTGMINRLSFTAMPGPCISLPTVCLDWADTIFTFPGG